MYHQMAGKNAGNQSILALKLNAVDALCFKECLLVAHLFALFLFNKHLLNIYFVLELYYKINKLMPASKDLIWDTGRLSSYL